MSLKGVYPVSGCASGLRLMPFRKSEAMEYLLSRPCTSVRYECIQPAQGILLEVVSTYHQCSVKHRLCAVLQFHGRTLPARKTVPVEISHNMSLVAPRFERMRARPNRKN